MKTLVFLFSLIYLNSVLARVAQDTALSQLSFKDLTPQRYQAILDKYIDLGYRPIDVEINADGNKRTYALIMRKKAHQTQRFAIHTKLTSQQFGEKWNQYKSQGYRIIDQESYSLGKSRPVQYFAGIWVKNIENFDWSSNRNLTQEKLHQRVRQYREQRNLMPIDIDTYFIGRTSYWSGVWVENKNNLQWQLEVDIPARSYRSHVSNYQKTGYQLLEQNSYTKEGRRYFSTIWIKSNHKETPLWEVQWDLRSLNFHNSSNHYKDRGYRLEDIEQYDTPSGKRFAGIWVENDKARTRWTNKSEVLKTINSYIGIYDPTGMSVGIAHKGEIKYARGFGEHNKEEGREAHAGTIYRTASIAKAISGTLGFILQDENWIDLEQKIRRYLPLLPQAHNYNLGDLLTNRSMVRHYFGSSDSGTEPSEFGDEHFHRAWYAVELFMNDPLVTRTPRYLYSTHGYSIFAAAVEKATKMSYCDLIDRYIARPQNLSTLRCENQNAPDFSNPERAQIYTRDTRNVSNRKNDDLSWKYAGGGLESSVEDLLRFGVALDQGKILSDADVQTMTSRPDTARNYGYGWDHGHDWGVRARWYAKDGHQNGARTYLRIYPDNDLVIAIMINHKVTNSQIDAFSSRLAQKALGAALTP